MGTLEINAIREYLLKVGCKIEYPILVNAFKSHLYNPDPNVQGKIRTQFKDFVNRLATVSLENNMKFIILRPEFRPAEPQPKLDTARPVEARQAAESAQQPAKLQHDSKRMPNIQPPTLPRTITAPVKEQLPPLPPPPRQPQPPPEIRPPPVPQHQRRVDSQQMVVPPFTPHMVAVSQAHSQSLSYPSSLDQKHRQQQQQYLPPNQAHHQQPKQENVTPLTRTTAPTAYLNSSIVSMNDENRFASDVQDGKSQGISAAPVVRRGQILQRPESFNIGSSGSTQMPPPRPPPRRRQSTASLFKPGPKTEEKSREIHDLAKRSPGRVKEHALKFNSSVSSTDLNALMPLRASSMKENRLSRDSTIGSLSSVIQRNGSHMTTRSRSSHREDESDSSSLQPIDPLRRKWVIEACNCNYNGLLTLLREDTKLASYKDIVNGYTALHWAAKFGNLDVIKLIAGTHGVSANIKSSAGYTPLHIACMFNRKEVADLLLKSYKANPDLRDHSGKRAMQYQKKTTQSE